MPCPRKVVEQVKAALLKETEGIRPQREAVCYGLQRLHYVNGTVSIATAPFFVLLNCLILRVQQNLLVLRPLSEKRLITIPPPRAGHRQVF